jgi:Leucine-rich repeat (LRR) protein
MGAMTSLMHLDISYNEITEFPETFSGCKLILTLDLSYNRLTQLPPPLASMITMKSLNASHNSINDVPEVIFATNDAIVDLNLQDNRIRESPKTFFLMKQLKKLIISQNKIKEFHKTTNTLCVVGGDFNSTRSTSAPGNGVHPPLTHWAAASNLTHVFG